MEINSNWIIKCPKCGREYLPCEIFYPEDMMLSTNVIKDENGKIIYFEGNQPDGFESYICDGCGEEFTVKVSMTFDVEKPEVDFDDDFTEDIK